MNDLIQGVVIAEKICHKGSLYGNVSNGGGVIKISDGIYIKFIAIDEKFVTLQILHAGNGKEIKTQSWVKGTTKKTEEKTSNVKLKNEVEQESLI